MVSLYGKKPFKIFSRLFIHTYKCLIPSNFITYILLVYLNIISICIFLDIHVLSSKYEIKIDSHVLLPLIRFF